MAEEVFTDLKVEAAVLRALRKYSDFRDAQLQNLRAEFFSKPSYRRLFVAIVESHARNESLSRETFEKWMDQKGLGDEKRFRALRAWDSIVSNKSELSPIVGCEVLRELFVKRGIVKAVSEKTVEGLRSGRSAFDVLADTRTEFDRITATASAEYASVGTPAETADQRLAEYGQIMKEPEKFQGIPFGIDDLDKVTNGLRSQETALIAGRSGSGKSRTLFNIAYNVSRSFHILYFTIEMPRTQVERIYTSRDGFLDAQLLKTGKLPVEQRETLAKVLQAQKETAQKFHIVDIPRGLSVPVIESYLRQFCAAYQIKMAFIDYVNIMASVRGRKEIWAELAERGEQLKQLSRVFKVPIVTAAQGNREMARALREGEEIGLDHIGLSDRLADNFDLVVLIHQTETEKLGNVLHWNVVKHRDGPRTKFQTFFDGRYNYVGNRTIEIKRKKGGEDEDET